MKMIRTVLFVMALCATVQLGYGQLNNSVMITSQIDTGSDDILLDGGNIAALEITATDAYDSGIDVPEPAPPVSNYISTYFPHPEWSTIFGDNFMVDARNGNDDLTNAVKVYDFEIDTDLNSEDVDLTFAIGSSFSAAYGVVLYDTESGTYQNIREDNTYTYTVVATVRSFELRLGDATAPLMVITYPTAGITLLVNTSYTITWTVTDISPIRYANLYYSLDNGSNWISIGTASGGSTSYPWTTPGSISTEALVKIEAEDWAGNIGSATMVSTFTIAAGHMENNFNSGWHMTSIPLIPPSSAIGDIFGDDVTGAYFVYNYAQSTGYGLVQTVENGYGYWLALENSALVDIDGATAVNQIVVPLTLHWNIVGAAMAEAIPRDDLMFSDGITTNSFVDAVNAGWISSAFYEYNNSTGSYVVASTLNPWGGYWLQTLVSGLDVITNPPYDNISTDTIVRSIDDEIWSLNISVSRDNLNNNLCEIGVYPDATTGYDLRYDMPSPPCPPSGDYVQLIFNHPEWSSLAGDLYCSDYRAPLGNEMTETWVGIIESSINGNIEISFADITSCLPSDYWVIAELDGSVFDLMDTPSFTIDYHEPLEIVITVSNLATGILDDLLNQPEKFELIGIYPNPFNPTTNIEFTIPETSWVTAEIFTTQGRLVSQLLQTELDPGLHHLTFDGKDLASGIYLLKIISKNQVLQSKLILMK